MQHNFVCFQITMSAERIQTSVMAGNVRTYLEDIDVHVLMDYDPQTTLNSVWVSLQSTVYSMEVYRFTLTNMISKYMSNNC